MRQSGICSVLKRLAHRLESRSVLFSDLFAEKPHLADRRLLESKIFPYIAERSDLYRILFVGCKFYTTRYEHFFRKKEYWTLDIDPAERRHGAKRHIIAPLKDLDQHVENCYFDVILCNGVLFPGAIDTLEEAEASFCACLRGLRSRGLFLLGWNDTPDLRPVLPEEIKSLRDFCPYVFPPLGSDRFDTDTTYRHVYNFYIRPEPQP